MTSEKNPKRETAKQGQASGGIELKGPVFYYKDSGIQEKHGEIPRWLMAVVVALLVWGVYYLIAYWSPPPV